MIEDPLVMEYQSCNELYKAAVLIERNPKDESLQKKFDELWRTSLPHAGDTRGNLAVHWQMVNPKKSTPLYEQMLRYQAKEIQREALDQEDISEFAFEDGENFDPHLLRTERMPLESYKEAHKGLPLLCHDIMVGYDDGLLLVTRDNFPAKNVLWPLGGRIERGLSVQESIRKKVKEECGLDLSDRLVHLGWKRTYFRTDPFEHGKGTDSLNIRLFGRGYGTINLDKLHTNPRVVKPSDYTPSFRDQLDPYIQQFMDVAIKLV